MFAIPSPDLLVNLFASGAQVLGLLAVALGGVFATKKRFKVGDAPRTGSRWPFIVTLLLLIGVSVSFAFYVLGANDANNRRLQTNLVRKSVEGGKKVGDTSLKTLNFSDQMNHPRAIASDTIATWIASGKVMNLIDVREPEEIEMGQIPGSWARRFPDLKVDRQDLIKPGVDTILLCDSGNRSSELSDLFFQDGIHTSFMIGGYEKWVAERRPLLNEGKRTSLRDIPDYPNKLTLLDTPEVERLVKDEGAIFVDVRYPEEFAKGALPGAINITLRKMLLSEIEPAIHALPRHPVIVPCYDKRSSFFGMLLGIRMHRLGYDFRGRYTVPHEYFAPPSTPQHLAAWEADQAQHTAFSLVVDSVGADLATAGHDFGGLLLVILLVVLAVRVLLLPFTLKTDRDQLVLRALAPKLEAVRARFAKDPAQVRSEVLALQRAARLTPLRNLLGTLVLLVTFLVLFAAVDVAAKEHATPILWLNGLGLADPLHVLPLAVGATFFAMLFAMAARVTRVRVACWLALGGVIAAAIWTSSAAVSIYLLISLGSMLIQRALFMRWWHRRAERDGAAPRRLPRLTPGQPLVPLQRAQHVTAAGRKAQRLAQLLQAGFPVPKGFVICEPTGIHDPAGRTAIQRALRQLKAPKVAVRSSGVAEDGADQSHAGEFDSLLQITGDRLFDAVTQVQQSLSAPRSRDHGRCDTGGVLVQAMVPAEHAGVLFTEDPGCAGAMLVEMTHGLGDGLVSGQVDPDAFRFGRRTLHPLQATQPVIDLAPLLELGRRAERLFGRPQDLEWAFAGGRFFILQSRDITGTSHDGAEPGDAAAQGEIERRRLLAQTGTAEADDVVFAQTELSELMPEPTPFSLALMNELWAKDGSVERAARRLGIPYDVAADSPDYAVSVFGRLYVAKLEERRRFARRIGARASLGLARGAAQIEQSYREDFLPRFRRELRLLESVDPARLSLHELIETCTDIRERFVRNTYVEAEVVNLASTFYTQLARQRLQRAGLNPAELLGLRDSSVLPRAIAKLRLSSEDPYATFLADLGHRAPHDFELSQPRYREARDEMSRLIAAARAGSDARRENVAAPAALSRMNSVALANADRFEALKEEAKHETLRELACLRTLLLELGNRLGLDSGIFWLLPAEIAASAQLEAAELRARIAARRSVHATLAASELPPELTVADLETVLSPLAGQTFPSAAAKREGALRGIRVAGAGDVYGRACILRDPRDASAFADGDVLVARFTDPRWLPLFRRARGIVAEVGGWLSHAAIQARELRLPAIVGVRGAMSRIQNGDLICLHRDGTVEAVADRRKRARTPAGQPIAIHAGEAVLSGRLVDVSEMGLGLADLEGDLNVGRVVRVELGGVSTQATVVRRAGLGAGIALHSPLARVPSQQVAAG